MTKGDTMDLQPGTRVRHSSGAEGEVLAGPDPTSWYAWRCTKPGSPYRQDRFYVTPPIELTPLSDLCGPWWVQVPAMPTEWVDGVKAWLRGAPALFDADVWDKPSEKGAAHLYAAFLASLDPSPDTVRVVVDLGREEWEGTLAECRGASVLADPLAQVTTGDKADARFRRACLDLEAGR